MTEADRKRFSATMGGLGVAFDLVPTAQRQGLYFDALRDLRIEALEWAAKEAVARLKFFPRAAELRELAGIAPPPPPDPEIAQEKRKLLEELPPVEMVRENLRGLAEKLNRMYGTSFRVDESRGRPTLVGSGKRSWSC